MRNSQEYTILDGIGIKTAVFTAATTDICTSAAHGLVDGNMVVLTTADTLPAGLALATVYWVKYISANTFYLCPTSAVDAAKVDITDTGTGNATFTMHDIGKNIFVDDYQHIKLSYDTDGAGDAAMTVKFQGSVSEDCPDFSAASSVTNRWDYVDCVDDEDGSSIDGDTGIAVAGADDHRMLEVNNNGLRWINAIISGWSEGEVTIKTRLYDNQ